MYEGFPLQNVVFFCVTSSINGGWVDIRCVKTKRLVRSKAFKTVEELESIKESVINQIISAQIIKAG